jgi:pimeloyl-ACP methyl ester carboxylesterase
LRSRCAADRIDDDVHSVGSGPPLVLVHGAWNWADHWLGVAERLAGSCTCSVLDRRGRGSSGDGDSYSFDREIEDIAAVVEAVGPGTSLLGHSSGGSENLDHPSMTTEQLGAALPDVRTVVLEGFRHDAHLLDPALVATPVRAFLDLPTHSARLTRSADADRALLEASAPASLHRYPVEAGFALVRSFCRCALGSGLAAPAWPDSAGCLAGAPRRPGWGSASGVRAMTSAIAARVLRMEDVIEARHQSEEADMKYFVAARPGPLPPTPEQFDAAVAWLDAKLDDGTFDSVYGFMEGGGFSIANAESHREAFDLLADYPLFGLVTFEVRALLDFKEGKEGIDTTRSKLAQAQEAMAAR